MDFHPIADIFPLMQGQEYEDLKADIAKNGLVEPIWLHPDGRIIDGRNRWRACTETNTNAKFEKWDGQGSLIEFILSLNLHRRHLTPSQAAMVATRALPMLEEEAKERQKLSDGRGKKGSQKIDYLNDDTNTGKSTQQAANLFGTNRQYVSDAKLISQEAPDIAGKVLSGELTIPKAKIELARRQVLVEPAITPKLPDNKYRCIVIDPPWPMKKIEREERPNQGICLDYPTMTLDEIKELPIQSLAHQNGCHLYLWVTQKFLPFGLELVEEWGFRYQCLLTWRKNVGMTPFSWMYDTEHVIFARCGNLSLLNLGLRLSFDAPVNGHSVKPNIFYNERVILASPEPRLEMFARKERKGFEVWGNEI